MRWHEVGRAAVLLLSWPAMVVAQPDVLRVRAGDRLAWDQRAPSAGIGELHFMVHVDDVPQRLAVTCDRFPGTMSFTCHATVPDLSPGVHVLAVSAHLRRHEHGLGLRSATLRVSADDRRFDPATAAWATTAGQASPWRMSNIASFVDVTDIALLDGAGVIVAERSGRVHVVSGNGEPLTMFDLDEVREEGGGLLSIAAELLPDGSRIVYAMYTSVSGLRVSRIALQKNALASPRIVIADRLPVSAERLASVVRIGPDGKLYLALEDGGDPSRVGDAAAYEGKVLRLNTDGTTPRDAVGGTPVYMVGLSRPADLIWVNDRSLWIVGSTEGDSGRLESRAAARADRSAGLRWVPSRAATYVSRVHPDLVDSVLIGDAREGGIWRVIAAADGSVGRIERIAGTNIGAVRAIATGTDGAVYVATATGLWKLGF
jgi:glucose/arabinose dehydrogenase